MNNTTQSTYTKYQEWLNDCPTKVLEYEDHVDTVNVRFELPIEEEYVNNEREDKFIDINNTGGKY